MYSKSLDVAIPKNPPFFFFLLSDLPFPRLHIGVPWTQSGVRLHFLHWPFQIDMTRPACFFHAMNQFYFWEDR